MTGIVACLTRFQRPNAKVFDDLEAQRFPGRVRQRIVRGVVESHLVEPAVGTPVVRGREQRT